MAAPLEGERLQPFSLTGEITSVAPQWKRWKRSFEFYVTGKAITNDEQKRALLLYSAGMEVQDLFETLKDPGNGSEGTEDRASEYEKAIRTLDAYFTPKINVPYERHIFRKMTQEVTETVDKFIARLSRQAINCSFGQASDEHIRDQVIDKCLSSNLRRKLLSKGTELTLALTQEIARVLEAVDNQMKNMELNQSEIPKPGEINKITSKDTYRDKAKPNTNKPNRQYRRNNADNRSNNNSGCFRCGIEGHIAQDDSCPAKSAVCKKCNLVGHYARKCKTKTERYNNGKPKTFRPDNRKDAVRQIEENKEFAFTVQDEIPSGTVNAKVGGILLNLLIDSGASCNIVDKITWTYLKQQKIKCQSEVVSKKLYAYGKSEPLDILGKFRTEIQIADRDTVADFYVINGTGKSLLCKDTAQQLDVLRLGPQIQQISSVDDLEASYPECFTGLGKLKGYQAKVHIDPDIKPVAQPVRRIPFGLRDKVEDKLQELVDLDIIEEAKGPTPWVSPIVVVPKPSGEIRLCVDMRQVNKAIQRERHPIPTVDEVIHDLNGSAVFSKIDLKWGFHQIELEEESRAITTFVTHVGMFRYKRLMFGMSSAPEIYQHIIRQTIAGCQGAANIADDIIIHGRDEEEHNARLHKVLKKLSEAGLTVNKDKCQFNMSELVFMGHKLSGRGISPSEEKVRAVRDARKPQNVAEVRSFLGLVQYTGRFIQDMATITEPLRRLTKKGIPFEWGNEQDESFQKLKDALTNAETLGYFDLSAKTQVISDASPVGLGAILVQFQRDQPRIIAYASRSLSDVESRYSQTEKEALGLVWACEKFHMYLYGNKFELLTDHKPLEFIYSERAKPPARIERWVLRLQTYNYTVKYIPGPKNIADSLSRMLSGETGEKNEAEEYIRFIAENAAPAALSIKKIEEESAKDGEISALRVCILTDNWSNLPPAYKMVRKELAVIGKLVLRGTRLVIPIILRKQILALAHEGHQGIVKCKQRLRTKVWWPGVDKEVEQQCKSCHGCQVVGNLPKPEPIMSTPLPSSPWEDLAADIMGPLPDGTYVLVVVDYYSRYFEIDLMKSTTTDRTIQGLEEIFARHGYPKSLKTDNGANFTSMKFEKFLSECDITHRKTTPLWPQANGEVERQNRTLLKAIKVAQIEKREWKRELNHFLLAYRSTPHSTTGESPAKSLFGRQIKCKLPQLGEYQRFNEMEDKDREMKQKYKDYADSRRHVKESDIVTGDKVLLRQSKVDKLSPAFCETPFEVVDKYHSQVVVQSPEGVNYKRNMSQVKKYNHGAEELPDGMESVNHDQEREYENTPQETTPARPSRIRKIPSHFRDFVTNFK